MPVSQLPQFQGADDPVLQQMQNRWATLLNPLLRNPLTQGRQMDNVALQVGDNVLDHLLSRRLQGWILVGMQGGYGQLYDKQDTNQTPQLTLVLNSSAAVNCSLWVY